MKERPWLPQAPSDGMRKGRVNHMSTYFAVRGSGWLLLHTHCCKDCRMHLLMQTQVIFIIVWTLYRFMKACVTFTTAHKLSVHGTALLFLQELCTAAQTEPYNVFMHGVVITGLLLPWHPNNNSFFSSSCSCHVI